MPQISFTPKNQTVYDRFSRLLLEEQLKRGKLTAPQFLDLVLDAFEEQQVVVESMQDIEKELQPVLLKDSDNRYVNNAIVATTNLFLTDDRSEAIVFDSPDKAKEFLRKYGRSTEGWILEPVNETE